MLLPGIEPVHLLSVPVDFPIPDIGGGDGPPLKYPCLENPMDRGAWWAAVHGVVKRQT